MGKRARSRQAWTCIAALAAAICPGVTWSQDNWSPQRPGPQQQQRRAPQTASRPGNPGVQRAQHMGNSRSTGPRPGRAPATRVRYDRDSAGNPLPRYAQASFNGPTGASAPRERLASHGGYGPPSGGPRMASRGMNYGMNDRMTYDDALRSGPGESIPPGASMHQGEVIYEDGGMSGDMGYGGGCSDCGDGSCGSCGGGGCNDCGDMGCGDCGGCGSCGSCGPGGYGCGMWPPTWWCLWENATVFGGVHSFKSGPDQGLNSNFGFHEGANFGMPLFPQMGWGVQGGGQIVHSNLSGSTVGGVTTSSSRTQYFATVGVFRRSQFCGPRGGGHQWGVVGDYMGDDFYANARFGQVRAEASWLGPNCNELGFWCAVGSNISENTYQLDNQRRIIERWQPNDLYSFFWRKTFCMGAQARVWGGFTGNGDGLVGADASTPISDCFGLQGGFNYLIPNEGGGLVGTQQEAWNITCNFVWYLGGNAQCASSSPYRPLMPVADNSVFLLERLAGSGAVAAP